jgi:hypothetical protein
MLRGGELVVEKIQRPSAFGPRIGFRVPKAAGSALAHTEASLLIQTAAPVPAGRLALLAQQYEHA